MLLQVGMGRMNLTSDLRPQTSDHHSLNYFTLLVAIL
jgi:hypothetical protein